MHKMLTGKETVKFLAIFDRVLMRLLPFSPPARDLLELPPVKFPVLKLQRFNDFRPQLLFAMNPQISFNTLLSGESKTHNA